MRIAAIRTRTNQKYDKAESFVLVESHMPGSVLPLYFLRLFDSLLRKDDKSAILCMSDVLRYAQEMHTQILPCGKFVE